jgi:methylenetetrahydrofolate reductase (NADPH)
VLSVEVYPPKADGDAGIIYGALSGIAALKPDYISVTFGAGGSDNFRLTSDICRHIKRAHGIEPLMHMTCMGNTKEGVATQLGLLRGQGIENILALRGDRRPGVESPDFAYASDLAAFIAAHGGYGVSGACYPECHFECASPDADIDHLKIKVDAGVTHLNSQLFFDNDDFFRFLDRARRKGITVPVQAGIMPIVQPKQIQRVVSLGGVGIPQKLARLFARFGEDARALMDAGIAYACQQIGDLLAAGVDGVHLYVMNKPEVAARLVGNIAGMLGR